MKIIILLVAASVLLLPAITLAHGGSLDSLGCHQKKQQRGYHCHKGELAGQYFNSKAKALMALRSISNDPLLKEYRTVIWVIDGDTIILNGNERVRLIGVKTPETRHPEKPVAYFGKEANTFTKKMVAGKKIRLEFDWKRKDRYGRTLAYIYLEDGTFLNAEIIKQGYGHAHTSFPFRYKEEFRQYEREARFQSRGLWKENKWQTNLTPKKW